PSGLDNSSIAFRFQGNQQGSFNMRSFSATAGMRPKLVIEYWSMQGEYISTTNTSNISKDDAKEANSGAMNLTYAYLNLGGRTDGNLSAIRFQNVMIPDEAEIEEAYIEFTAYGASPAGQIQISSEL